MGEWRKRRQQQALALAEPLPDEIGQHVEEIGQRLADINQQWRDLGSEIWAKARALADEQLIGLRHRLEMEKDELGAQMTEAVRLADRLTEEAEALRRQLADHQSLQAEHQGLKAHAAEVERRHADELVRADERTARQDKAAAEAGAAEKTALERAARAEGQVEALKNQLVELTALLQPSAKDSAMGTHRGGTKDGD
jgi:hypothetical protein